MKKIKGLLLFGILTLLGIGISFGNSTYSVSVLRTSIYNTNISDSKNISSKNYYSPTSFEYVNRNQNCRSIYTFNGYGIYTNFSSFTFNYSSGLNNYYYLHNNNGNIESVQYSVGGCNTDISNPTYYDSSYFNYGYNNSVFNGSVSFIPYFTQGRYSFPNGYYLGWGNTGGNSIDTSSSQYVHLYYNVGVSDFSYNPGIIDGSVDILHYLYRDGKKIYSDYGDNSDVPDSYTRKKLFENLNSTYSYVAIPDSYDILDSSNIEFFSSYGPIQWSFNESNNSYHIFPAITGGHLLLNFIDYESDSLTGNSTLVLQLSGNSIIYNYYYNYSPFIQQLDLNNPTYKGYLTSDGSSLSAFNLFVAFLTDNGFYFDSVGSFQNGLTLRSYRYGNQSTNQYGDYHFDFVESSDIPIIIPDSGGGNGNQPTYSGSVSFDNCIETTVYNYSSGSDGNTLVFSRIECLSPEIIESGSYVGSNGTIYYVDSSYNVGNISNPDGTLFDTGYLDVDGLLTIDYYSGLFNGQGFMFGVCPYPPSDYLNFATKIKLGNFYPFMPLNCFISAFQQGVKVHYFDDSGLFPDNHSQLMSGDSHYHKTLFRFFDVLLSIGLLLLLSALLRIIKK